MRYRLTIVVSWAAASFGLAGLTEARWREETAPGLRS
jgi:hypothetical protein